MPKPFKKSINIILKYPILGVCFSIILSQFLSVTIGYLIHESFRLDSFLIATVISMIVAIFTIKLVNQYQIKVDLEVEKNMKLEIQLLDKTRLASIGRIAGALAHEINNPLAIIRLQMDLLMKLSKTGKMNSEIIEKSARRINETLDRISKITSDLRIISQDSRNSDRKSVAIDSVINETLKDYNSRMIELGVQFTLNSSIENIYIRCNPTEISQALIKLLNNSIESVEKLELKKIAVDLEKKGDFIFIRVSNTGKIPDEIKDRIMEPFFTTKPVGSGNGLGLSISKGIIESHGGELTFNSSLNKTEFSICLPIDYIEKKWAS